MKNDRLLEAIGEIDGCLVQAAAPKEGAAQEKSQGVKGRIKWTVIAACFAVAILAGAERLFPAREPVIEEELPMLSITGDFDGMGYEVYLAYDIYELSNDNPWTEDAELTTLPVYKNTRCYSMENQITEGDVWDMEELLRTIAARLGLDTNSLKITRDIPEDAADSLNQLYYNSGIVSAEADGISIMVDSKLNVDIRGLLKVEQNLLPMQSPRMNVSGGDYNIHGERSLYHIFLYDGAGELTEQIVNYNFEKLEFSHFEDSGLWNARLTLTDLSEKAGNYPILTVKEARKLLMAGDYITTVPAKILGEEYIAKVELVYKTGQLEKYFIPYYRFYVEIPNTAWDEGITRTGINGLKSYGIYYVPAVQPQYISDKLVEDGGYN